MILNPRYYRLLLLKVCNIVISKSLYIIYYSKKRSIKVVVYKTTILQTFYTDICNIKSSILQILQNMRIMRKARIETRANPYIWTGNNAQGVM